MRALERTVGGSRSLLVHAPDSEGALPSRFEGQSWSACQLTTYETDRLICHHCDVKEMGYAVVLAPSGGSLD